jgi:hypothetical protein
VPPSPAPSAAWPLLVHLVVALSCGFDQFHSRRLRARLNRLKDQPVRAAESRVLRTSCRRA